MDKIFWRIVPVHVYDDNVGDGPEYAVIHLDADQIKRIQQLARIVKELNVAYIVDWDYTVELMTSEEDLGGHRFNAENPWKVVTDRTTKEKLGTLVNHESPVVQVMVKQRLAGYKVYSPETLLEMRTLLKEYDSSVDCEKIQVSSDDFRYTGCLKHTNIEYSSEGIPLKELPKIK